MRVLFHERHNPDRIGFSSANQVEGRDYAATGSPTRLTPGRRTLWFSTADSHFPWRCSFVVKVCIPSSTKQPSLAELPSEGWFLLTGSRDNSTISRAIGFTSSAPLAIDVSYPKPKAFNWLTPQP